jgi:hypothetical protein
MGEENHKLHAERQSVSPGKTVCHPGTMRIKQTKLSGTNDCLK